MALVRALFSLGWLLMAVVACALLGASLPVRTKDLSPGASAAPGGPTFHLGGTGGSDKVRVSAPQGHRLWVSTTGDGTRAQAFGIEAEFPSLSDGHRSAQRISVPTSLQWDHPLPSLPSASVFLAEAVEANGIATGTRMHTVVHADHGRLPVLSIIAPDGAFFDQDSGLMVVGNTMLHPPADLAAMYARDPRFWKYPGNFHLRGKAWERRARAQFIAADGTELWQEPVGIRINGQMTRGLRQHALRILFDEPLEFPVFGPGSERCKALVMRAAGNDQSRAMVRDAFQHGLCEGATFEISPAVPCVVYLNGAYWGVHYLRPRMDHKELARRHGISPKEVAIIEDRGVLVRGSSDDLKAFRRLVDGTYGWKGKGKKWADSLHAKLDVEGFIDYMATQLILGNMDWPAQNVKYWRYTGEPVPGGKRDGRWYPIMGDSDLGFGAQAGPEADLLIRVRTADVPTSKLFVGMMRSPELRAIFVHRVQELVSGPFSAHTSTRALSAMQALLEQEMVRHTARWRKPADMDQWHRELDVLRRYAEQRPSHVMRQLKDLQYP